MVGAAELTKTVQERLGDDALSVISHDDGIRGNQSGLQRGQQLARGGGVVFGALFPVHAHDLLLVGHNAGFDAGRPGFVLAQAAAVNAIFGQ